ncbi:hypothetical protein GCM10023185_29770 [Hymenobacter saemangeumensis]|uniref:Uncharacterized protein n=1 Tax=Hymenobacter saemangeumensis TaxID=1084522 RepID=A0ABP8ILK7_9BACT
MENVIAPTPRVEGLRVAILELVNASAFTTPAEKATAAQRVAACQNEATLTKWYRNTLVELAEREEAAPVQAPAISYATASQKETIIRLLNHPTVTRQMKTKSLLNINRLTVETADKAIADLQAHIDTTTNGPAPKGGGCYRCGEDVSLSGRCYDCGAQQHRAPKAAAFRNARAFAHYGSATQPMLPGNEVAFTLCNN